MTTHEHTCRGCGTGYSCHGPLSADEQCADFDGYCADCDRAIRDEDERIRLANEARRQPAPYERMSWSLSE